MSWHAWTEQGYGVPLLTGKNFTAIKRFLIEREKDNKKIAEIRECEDENDMFDILGDPLSWCIGAIIRDETGYRSFLGFDGCGDTDFDPHIGFAQDFPWKYGEKDKKLTLEEAQRVLDKYAKELEIDASADYFEAFYCG